MRVGTPLIQMVEHKTGNLRVAGSSPTLDIGRHGLPIHPVVKWVPGI